MEGYAGAVEEHTRHEMLRAEDEEKKRLSEAPRGNGRRAEQERRRDRC
jgi:hypothetical protein